MTSDQPTDDELVARIAQAQQHLHVRPLMRDVFPRDDDPWVIVDESSAEPEVNWPGDLVSEHKTREEAVDAIARLMLAVARGQFQVGKVNPRGD